KTVPEKHQLKFDGRPVMILWSVNNFVDSKKDAWNKGKLSPILQRIRADFKSEFGTDPFIIVDQSFQHRDPTVVYPIVDAMNDWFTMDKPFTVRKFNNVSVGVG